MKDIDKLIAIAEAFGDNYEMSHRVFYVPSWRKRFIFNDKGEIEKMVFRQPHSTKIEVYNS